MTSSILNSGSDNPFLSRRDCLNGFHTKSISSLVYPSEIKLHDYRENIRIYEYNKNTRMHSSRMRTIPCPGRLSCHVSHVPPLPHTHPCHTCPSAMHTPCHVCLPATHPLSCMPPLPCMPPTHAHTPSMHAPLPHVPPLIRHVPLCHTHPPHHACPPSPHMSPPRAKFLTDACENITFLQLLLRTVINTSLFK